MSATQRRQPTELDRIRKAYLDALVADDELTDLQHSLLLTRIFAGHERPDRAWVVRSLASYWERAGGYGLTLEEVLAREHHNSAVSRAHRDLAEGRPRKWWKAKRRENRDNTDGPGTPSMTLMLPLPDDGPRKAASSSDAYGAAMFLALRVSPLGPKLERDYLRLRWAVDVDNVRTYSADEWAPVLRCANTTVPRRLAQLAEVPGLGMSVSVIRPRPGQSLAGGRAKAKVLYRVELSRIDDELFALPQGAKRHAQKLAARRQWVQEAADTEALGRASSRPSVPVAGLYGHDEADYELPPLDVPESDVPDFLKDEGAGTDELRSDAAELPAYTRSWDLDAEAKQAMLARLDADAAQAEPLDDSENCITICA